MSGTHIHGFACLNQINEDGESGEQTHYFDEDTGLHYNFFRYYEPDAALPKWIAYGVLGAALLSKPRIPLKDIQPDPIDW